jgi:TPR repeat protein
MKRFACQAASSAFRTRCRPQSLAHHLSRKAAAGTVTALVPADLRFVTPRAQWYSSTNIMHQESPAPAPPGDDFYQQALQAMDKAQQVQEEREEERSRQMYEAWQKAEKAEKNPKTQAVVVVKTIVKQARKKIDDDINYMQQHRDFLEQAAALEHPVALVQLGNLALQDAKKKGANQQESIHKAMDLFRRSGQVGNRVGWYNLGQLLWTGYPALDEDHSEDDDDEPPTEQILAPDLHEATEAFTNAIDLGDPDAMYLVGVHRMTTGHKEPIFSGMRLIDKAGGLGHGGALYYLALLHLNGEEKIGLAPITMDEFMERLDRAVEAGSLDARFTRGHSYYHGTEGYPQDSRKALVDFLKAADEGHADAAVSAGAMLHSGIGVVQDQQKAFELYQHAGELGSIEGWQNVVACYTTGEGVPKSPQTAKYIKDTMLKDQ